MNSFTIPGELPSLNEYIRAERGSKFAAAKIKSDATLLVTWLAISVPLFSTPVHITFRWFVPNMRKDPDNVVFAKKFILDGLVAAGVIPDDSMKWIRGLTDYVELDRDNPRIEVEITACGKKEEA